MPIQEVQPGAADDPFTKGASAQNPDGASKGVPADQGTENPSGAGGQQTVEDASADAAKAKAAAVAAGDDDGAASDAEDDDGEPVEFSDDEQAALDVYFQHRLETETLPKIQSNVDRRVASMEAAAKKQVEAARAETQAVRDELRQVKLNGLPPEDQEKLKSTWAIEDREAANKAYEEQLEGMYRDIVVTSYVTEYPHLQLTPADFAEFDTPEQMEVFVALADREYYKELAARGGVSSQGSEATAPAPKPKKSPAGATAPSDGSAGSAVPDQPKFNKGSGRQAMVENIGGGWETVQIAR